MRKLQKKAAIKFAAACTLLLFSIISCEIGLGGAVDTQAPSLTIDSPKVDAVIRDVFAISGRWSDDGTIDSLNVTLKRTDGSFTTPEIKGEWIKDEQLNETGTWHAVIDYKELSIPDGTYQATVSIKDKGHHETTQSTTFTIDNTAPVLVLSRPSTKSGAKGFDSYGQTFTLEGKAADDNEVSLIEVNIFESEDSTEPLKTIELKNVPLTIEQDVAKFVADAANDYAKIYGHVDENGIIIPEEIGESEQRYCTITIYDGAQRYPEDGSPQTEEDKKGNSTNSYYMNSEIVSILSTYKITDLYHIKNKTYNTGAERAASTETIEQSLIQKVVTKSQFSINPANNPKFVVTSRSALKKTESGFVSMQNNVNYQLTEGNSNLEVEISPGLDNWPIDTDSVGLYLWECDEYGVPKENDGEGNPIQPIWLIEPGEENHTADKATVVQSGETYKFKTANPIDKNSYQGLSIGSFYLIKVVGKDTRDTSSGGDIISDGTFAFQLISSGDYIELSGQGEPEYISRNQAAWNVEGHQTFTVTLKWKSTDSDFDVYRAFGSSTDESKISDYNDENNRPEKIDNEESIWQYKDVIDYSLLNSKTFPSGITYCLKKNGDIVSTKASIRLRYDDDEPGISNIQFTNSYVKVEETEVNGKTVENYTYYVRNQSDNKCAISGIATDNTGIETVKIVVPGLAQTINPVETGRFKFDNIDFSTVPTSTVTASIIATDVAGNQETHELNIIFDTTPPHGVHEIDASSKNLYLRVGQADNDDIKPGNALWDDDLDEDVGGKYGNGTFGNATTIQIRGNFSDIDANDAEGSGVAMIYYKVYETEQLLDDTLPTPISTQIENIKNEVLNDYTGRFTPLAAPETRRVFYNVGRKLDDNDVPLDPAQPDTTQVFEGSTQFTNTPNSKGYYKYYKTVESTFNETITGFNEGNNYLVLVAVDNVGNSAIDTAVVNFEGKDTTFVNYTLNVDKTPPSDITTESTKGIIYTNGENLPLLWGTVSDKCAVANASAGMSSFVLSRDGVDTAVSATLLELTEENLGTLVDKNAEAERFAQLLAKASDETIRIWKADVSSLLPDESRTISISATAKDAAGVGNTTPGVVATITVDKIAPTVTIDADSPTDADTDEEGVQVNGSIKLSGTSDDTSGIEELAGLYYKVYTNAMPAAPAANTVIPAEGNDGWYSVAADASGTTNWKFNNINTAALDGTTPVADNSKVCFTVAIKDKAGNIGYSTPKALVIDQDTDRPVIHLSTLPLTYKDENEQTQKMTSADPVWFNRSELSGTVNDDDGAVEYVKVIAKDASDENVPSVSEWESAVNVYKNGIWSYTIPSNGSKKIYLQVKDKNGTVFTSNTASTATATYGPKIIDTDDYKFGYNLNDSTADDILYVKVDTDDPVLEVMKYYASSELVEHPEDIPDYNSYTQEPGWKIAESSIIPDKFGGTNKYIYIKCKTYDTNGISSVSFKFADINPLDGKTTDITQVSEQDNYKEIITCFNIKEDPDPVASGLTKLEINIKDNAAANTGSSGISKYYEAMVDNTEPEINFSNYTKGSQVYGSSAVTLRGTTSDSSKVEKVEYALSDNGYAVPTQGWIEITDETKPTYTSKLGWQIVFDGKTPENDNTFTDPSSYHAALLKESLFSLYSIPQEQQAAYDTTQKIYIWMRATDELGNVGTNMPDENYEGFFLDVIPNGDRPAIEITYPADSSSVGGTIRITGTTDIQDTSASVKYVYLQIDPSYDKNAGFNAAWATELDELLHPQEGNAVTSYLITNLTNVTVNGIDLGTKIGSGIASQGNSKMNWYLTINGNKEFNGKVNNDNRTIGIRAAAVSSTGKVSFSEVHACTIDPDAPIFGQTNELRFVQFDGQGNETASRKFENGLYLKGRWYLVGSVEDDSGLREIKLGSQSIVYSTGDEGAEVVTNASNGMAIENNSILSNVPRFKNYDLKIPVGNSEVDKFGKLDYEISVTDGSTSQIENTLKFSIFYDNKAPDFEAQKGNEIPLETNGKIFQSNGSYTVKGTFAEPSEGANNQSGFNRIAMFFTRKRVEVENGNTNTNLYLIDPMIESGDNGEKNFVKLGRLGNDGNVAAFESNISLKDGLFWRKVTASLENTNELTVASGSLVEGALPSNIRAGGLCMINNVVYRIKSISGTKLILEGSISDFTDKPVYFAFAQVIDNQSQESGTVGLYQQNDLTTNKDGDCMIEGVIFGAGVYNWNASVDSSNMLDGNVTMSFVAYDAAGNYTEQNFEQKISNNAPRIAGVIFGTDTNLDGDILGNEKNEYYCSVFTNTANPSLNGYDKFGNRISSYEIPERLTVKGKVMVKPMIVGGNHALGNQYSFSTTTGTYTSDVAEYAGVGHSKGDEVRTSDLTINVDLMTFITKKVQEGNQNITFTIWDKTDGSTLGDESSGSARADIILPANVVINDNVDPTITIDPFYWKSQTENSLYQNNVKNGHIELIGELPTGNDGDAMVSGKITFDGTATDNVIVEKLYVSITGYDGGEGVGSPFAIAERDKTKTATDGWNSSSLYYEKNGQVVEGAANTLDNNDWVFELLSDTYAEDGRNTVVFKFHFNTEKHPDAAKANVIFGYTAEDKGSPSSTGEYTNAHSSTDDVKVDIVPYITKVYTSLAKLKANNWSVYNRTALGHYAVASDETIYLYGFNLGNETNKPVYKYGNNAEDTITLAAPVNGGVTNIGTEEDPLEPPYPNGSDYATYSVVSFDVSNVPSSGEITLLVNGVPIQNNKNNKDAKGGYTGTTSKLTGDKTIYDNYYNRQPNGDNNNLLTDDVVLDVWEIDPQAVKPKSGTASQPVMAINPVNNQIGFAFVNGSLYYSMAAGTPGANNTTATTPNSYEYWVGGIDFWTSVGFAYDQKGHSFGTVAGGDINSGKADMFRIFTSYWGKGWLHNNGYRNGQNQFRLELVGQKDFEGSGTSYAAFDNFNKERIKSPSITTVSTSDNTTTVYLAYYDEINDEIRFKWGNFGDERKKPSALFIDYYGEHHNDKSGTNDTGWDNSGYDSVIGNKNLKEYTLDYISLIAGHTEDKVTATNGTKVSKIVKSKANKDVYAGKYVSIVALPSQGDSDDAVIAIWWDGTNNQMLYSYNLKPQSITAGTYTHSQTGWSEPKAIFGEGSGIGEYCKVVADKNNHIHIACYDGLNGDLYYAYIDNFQEPQNAKTCIVDSYGIIGTEIGIDVGLKSVLDEEGNPVLENGNPKYITVPYISYYAGSSVRPKIASWAGEANIKDSNIFTGADNEAFTGCWDVSLIPTGSRVSNDHVNVGLWKDDGVIKDSVANTNTHTPGMGHTNSYGTVWGNGTANPVLGYAVTKGANGYIETAQMK